MKVSSHPAQVTKKKKKIYIYIYVYTTIFRSEERPLLSAQVPGEIEYSFTILQHRYGIIEQSLPFRTIHFFLK
jgi:hypothetical protein